MAMARQVLEFMVKFFGGGGGEPTPEKPVTGQTIRNGKTDVSVKTIVDFDHASRVEKLAKESMRIKAETADLLKQMTEDMKAKGQKNG